MGQVSHEYRQILVRVKMATLQVGDTASVSSQNLEQFRDESKRKSPVYTNIAMHAYSQAIMNTMFCLVSMCMHENARPTRRLTV